MKIVSFDCPEVNSLSGYKFMDFPNPANEGTKLFRFISENPGCTRDTLYDNFSTIGSLMWFRNNDLVRCAPYNKGGYELTSGGKEVIKFIDWLEPVYEVIELARHIGPQNFDELDVGATMTGRHDLVEEEVATRLEMIRRWNTRRWIIRNFIDSNGNFIDSNSNLRGMKKWMNEVLCAIETSLITVCSPGHELYDLFEEKYSLDFS